MDGQFQYNIDDREDDYDEVEDIPRVAQIRELAHGKAHRNDLECRLDDEPYRDD